MGNADHEKGSANLTDQEAPKLSWRPLVVIMLVAVLAVWFLRRHPLSSKSANELTSQTPEGIAADSPTTASPQPVEQSPRREREDNAPHDRPVAVPRPSSPSAARKPSLTASTSDQRTPFGSQSTPRPERTLPPGPGRQKAPADLDPTSSIWRPSSEAPTSPRKIPLKPPLGTPTRTLPSVWERDLERLAGDYSVEVVWQDTNAASVLSRRLGGQLRFASRSLLAKYVPVLVSEFRVYPVQVIERMPLKRIVLCRDLNLDLQSRAGLAIPDEQTIVLDVAFGNRNEEYARLAFHHEIFHMIDKADDGSSADPGWNKLNPTGFSTNVGPRG